MSFIKMITAWSFSRLEKYRKCPRLAKRIIIDKLTEPENDAMRRGSIVHGHAQSYTEKKTAVLDKSLELFADRFKKLRTMKGGVCEVQIAISSLWEQCDWKDWRLAWCRIVADFLYVGKKEALIIDHKTGRMREESKEQLSLYAAVIMSLYPKVEKVTAELWYLDSGDVVSMVFPRTQLVELREYWVKESSDILRDSNFRATPSANSCRFCPDSKAKGGTCKY